MSTLALKVRRGSIGRNPPFRIYTLHLDLMLVCQLQEKKSKVSRIKSSDECRAYWQKVSEMAALSPGRMPGNPMYIMHAHCAFLAACELAPAIHWISVCFLERREVLRRFR
jgi:hypothetical protein